MGKPCRKTQVINQILQYLLIAYIDSEVSCALIKAYKCQEKNCSSQATVAPTAEVSQQFLLQTVIFRRPGYIIKH